MFFDRSGVTPSYGPGRYDTRDELDGIDYPAGYVRWTDNRSLSAVNAQQKFGLANGASGTIVYLTGGDVRYPKETMDATGGGRNARLDNFRSAAVWTGRRKRTVKARGGQDKGQQAEMEQFVEAVWTGAPMPITVDSLIATTWATIAVRESLLSGRPEKVRQ